VAEIEKITKLGCKEIFDDSGTFPVGDWMHNFCEEIIKLKEKQYVPSLGCNMRSGILKKQDWNILKKAGFRTVLLGFESGNDSTLQALNKGYSVSDVICSCENATKSGLEPHVTTMVGFPFETERQVWNTVDRCRDLFRKGWIRSLQATLCIPYPGTALFKEADEKGWLLTKEWEDYDQTKKILKTDYDPIPFIKELYKSSFTPLNIIRALMEPSTLLKKTKYLLGHL
jgi:radical SAM superfamily enzyme YgiQ (UPF0313 family)